MSSLQKQSPKKRGRKGSGASRSGAHWLRALALAVRVPLRMITIITSLCLRFPRVSAFFVVFLALVAGGWWTIHRVEREANSIVPRNFSVESTDASLQNRIMRITSITLSETRKNSWSREQMMRRLEDRINAIENLDSAHIRAGFDGQLRIFATPQAPKLILEISEDQRLVIGSRMSVIGKLPSAIPTATLPWLVATEAKLATLSSTAGSSANGQNQNTKRNLVVGVNLPWLHSGIQTILAENQTFSTAGFTIDRFYWRSASGLSLKIQTTKRPAPTGPASSAASATSEPLSTIHVLLGENDLAPRVKKLREMLVDFSARGVTPESIDLNFPDKAIVRFKVSEASNPPKL